MLAAGRRGLVGRAHALGRVSGVMPFSTEEVENEIAMVGDQTEAAHAVMEESKRQGVWPHLLWFNRTASKGGG